MDLAEVKIVRLDVDQARAGVAKLTGQRLPDPQFPVLVAACERAFLEEARRYGSDGMPQGAATCIDRNERNHPARRGATNATYRGESRFSLTRRTVYRPPSVFFSIA